MDQQLKVLTTRRTKQSRLKRFQRFVVTTYTRQSNSQKQILAANRRHIQIWDTSSPLTIGYPFRWIIECTEAGIRIRNIAAPFGTLQADTITTVTDKMVEQGTPLELPYSVKSKNNPLWIKIEKIKHLPAAYKTPEDVLSLSPNNLRVFFCIGRWVRDARSLNNQYTAQTDDRKFFKLQYKKRQYHLTSLQEGLHVTPLQAPKSDVIKTLNRGESLVLSETEIARVKLRFEGPFNWNFSYASVPEVRFDKIKHHKEDAETRWYQKALMACVGAFTLLSLLPQFFMKEEPLNIQQNLIPAQYARLVLKKTPEVKPQGGAQKTPEKATAKIAQSTVVQAFRAQALKHNIKGLLKGGLTSLLAQSNIVAGARSEKARSQLFSAGFQGIGQAKGLEGMTQGRQVQVAAIGGGGVGGKDGKGVGYAVGQGSAGVAGQGEAFVTLDIADSTVQEGLTKDEVGKVIHQHLSEVRYCYESAMVRNPDVEGKLVVEFTINPTGTVKSSAVQDSSLPDPRLDDCILRRLVKWQFPKPKGGVQVAVTYPFIFKSLGR